jgi:hypothetical protein
MSFKNSFICLHARHCFLVHESHFSSLSLYFSILFMSLFPTSGYVCCQGCNKPFKRLSTHILNFVEVTIRPFLSRWDMMSQTCKEVIAHTLTMKLLLLLLHNDRKAFFAYSKRREQTFGC